MRMWYALIAAVAIAGCSRQAEETAHAAHAEAVDFPVSCAPSVQDDFEKAVVLLHHMTYVKARAAFRDIAARDPDCAMANWGVAMTLFQPLWPTRPGTADLHLGWDLAQKAAAMKPTTPREQAYIATVAEFFREPDATDYWQRIQRWETSLAALHAKFPDDREGTAFYALALLASAKPGPTLAEHSREASDLLLPILREHPDHPGAMHYLIHADDIPGREGNDPDVVHHYEETAPDNPHALHMPTHIYTRLGDWDGVIRGNLRAADAALKFPAGEHGEFVWDEFAHAIEYLVYAYLQQGQDDEAAKQTDRLLSTPNIEPSSKTAFHLASTRARNALERRDYAAAAALVPREPDSVPWDRFPWAEGVAWFARGFGAAHIGDAAEAERASAKLGELDARATAGGEDVFARQIRILKFELDASNAHATRDDASALALMQEAVDLETATPKPAVTPAPTLPASELLGDLLLELKRPADAATAYRAALQRYPNRFNATLGLARALAQAGDKAGAAAAYGELLRIAGHGTRASLGEARDFVAANPDAKTAAP
ncbi:MAG TPA: tetratricopeptide repeat protein [Rhodanobacteraceae bacterium]|nr:tetratricopeptide repeat protein [Rhodanobacteraceae bacterium]